MTTTKKEKILNASSFDALLDAKYGTVGTRSRDVFEEKAQYFVISEMLENGKCDIQLSTLYKIFEFGLGKRVNLLFG